MAHPIPAAPRSADGRCSLLLIAALCLALPRASLCAHAPSRPRSTSPPPGSSESSMPFEHSPGGGRSVRMAELRRRVIASSAGEKALHGYGRVVDSLYPAVNVSPKGAPVVKGAEGGQDVGGTEVITKTKMGCDKSEAQSVFPSSGDEVLIYNRLFGNVSEVEAKTAIKEMGFAKSSPLKSNEANPSTHISHQPNPPDASRSDVHRRRDDRHPGQETPPAGSSERNDETSRLTSVIGSQVTRVTDRTSDLSSSHTPRPAPVTRRQNVIRKPQPSEGGVSPKPKGEVNTTSVTRQVRGQRISYTGPRAGDTKAGRTNKFPAIDHQLPEKDRHADDPKNPSSKTSSLLELFTVQRYDNISPCRSRGYKTCMRFKLGKKIPEGTKDSRRINSTSELTNGNENSIPKNDAVKNRKESTDAAESSTRSRRKALTSASSLNAESSLADKGLYFNSISKGVPKSEFIQKKIWFSRLNTSEYSVKHVNDKIPGVEREKIDAEDQERSSPFSLGQENAIRRYRVEPGERNPTMEYERPPPFIERTAKSIHDGASSRKQGEQDTLNYRPETRLRRMRTDLERKPFVDKGKQRKRKRESASKNTNRMPLPAPASSNLAGPSEYKIWKASPRRSITNGEGTSGRKTSSPASSFRAKEHGNDADKSLLSKKRLKSLVQSAQHQGERDGRLPFSGRNFRRASNAESTGSVGLQAGEENITAVVSKGKALNPIKRVAGRAQPTPPYSNSFSLTGEVHKDYVRKASHSRKLLQFQESDAQDSEGEGPRRNAQKDKQEEATAKNLPDGGDGEENSKSLRNTTAGGNGNGNPARTPIHSKNEGHQKSQAINYSHFPPGFGGIDEGEGCNCWPTHDESFKPEVECRCQGEHLARLPTNISTDVDRL
ncbi:hypothetical protein C7M84_007605 [Penaeus vannamei]|uniref:Uncharacterized protein n=1 Tax=Penaeus vannamei TaxID=6689 RepID=A0A423TBX2_PENVA|nr:hypothetical protein C7M84_007605 [Penaeus vannamei]